MKAMRKKFFISLFVITVTLTIAYAEICAQMHLSQPVEYDQAVFDHISLGYEDLPFVY